MEEQIRDYVENLFESAPYTQRIYELKLELIQNLTDKYHDLLAEGKTPDDAYNITILGIGDINELIASVNDSEPPRVTYTNEARRRSAACVSISVMLYILSVVPLIILSEIGGSAIVGVVIMFVMIAAATGLIIYNSMTKPKKNAQPETVVEDFKQWQNQKNNSNSLYKAIMSAYWPLVLAVYFLLSFSTGRWDVTWIIFLISPAVSGIIKSVMEIKNK